MPWELGFDIFAQILKLRGCFILKIPQCLKISTLVILIKEFRSYFKVVILAPSFCGESSFRVRPDWVYFFRRWENVSYWHVLYHWVSNKHLVINNLSNNGFAEGPLRYQIVGNQLIWLDYVISEID